MTTDLTSQIEIASSQIEPQELENLGPGCYVQIQDKNRRFWVEITAMNDGEFSGILHCELGGSTCHTAKVTLGLATFNKNQIINLGCDNYCWC